MSTVAEPKPKKPAKAKEPKPKKEKPVTVRVEKWRVENWARCKELNEEIDKLQIEYAQKKTETKELKETISSKITTLRRLSNEGKERMPLFDGPEPKKDGDAAAAPAVAANEAWRDVLLLDALCKPGTLTKPSDKELTRGVAALVKGKVETVGKLETLRATGIGGRKWWASIKGLTEEPAQKVEDAALKWLSEHRDKAVLAEAREAGKPEAKKAGKKSKAK